MKKIIVTFGLILLLGNSIICSKDFHSFLKSSKYIGWISRQQNNSKLILSAKFKNNKTEPILISYKFSLEKKGTSGITSNSQSGTKLVGGNTEVLLSVVNLNFYPLDNYKARLRILKDNIVISSDSLFLN